jgi:hypothetical protein
MLSAVILCIGLGTIGAGDYARPLGESSLDEATLATEGFGDKEKKVLIREKEGLRVTIKPGEPEAGWKTPQQLRIGGDFAITATLDVRKLPKPAQDDGAALGMAIATQSVDQPDVTLLRELEPDGKDVYRVVPKSNGGGQPVMMIRNGIIMNQFGNPQANAKPERHVFPARGNSIRLEFRRQGQTVRCQVTDEVSKKSREIGQFPIGTVDVVGVKLFVSNRNGAEPIDVLFRDLTIHADRLTGLGTSVRSIAGNVIHGEPTGLDGDVLVIGGPPPTATPSSTPAAPTTIPANVFQGTSAATPAAPVTPRNAAAAVTIVAPAAPAAPAMKVAVRAARLAPADPQIVATTSPATPADAPSRPPGSPAAAHDKARIPLNEVESITFERAATLQVRYQGQANIDLTGPAGTPSADDKSAKKGAGDDLSLPPPGTVAAVQSPKVEPKPSGIRDMRLALSNLMDAAIQQVVIQGQTDKGQVSWQLDTTGSTAGPISLRRAGNASWADLFFEPPAEGDCKDKQFQVNVTYANGQSANAQFQIKESVDPKLKFDPASPSLEALVYMVDDERLTGRLDAISESALTLNTPWGDSLDIPLTRIRGVYVGMPDHKESPEAFARRLESPGAEDLLLARAKDGEVVAIAGIVEGLKANTLSFQYKGKTRTLALKQVEGFVLANRPPPEPPDEVRATFMLPGGIAVSGRWKSIEAETWSVEAPWGQLMKLPSAEIQSVRFRGGVMSYLSDLEPSEVEQTPYFGRVVPYRRDVNLEGNPLKLGDNRFDKGLAVHSRTALTYDLDRRFSSFQATIGFDATGKQKGRVDCRILADGKELYANPDLRADTPPVDLNLDIKGVEQLQLIVDFGPDEDTGDRVIWADARVFRHPPATKPTEPASGQ